MLTWEILVAWSVLMCGGEGKATENCVRWAEKCIVKEFAQSWDADNAFEYCSENIPVEILPK